MPPRIGVYDSGAGGLTTLALLQAKLPECSWVYFADNARMPFGSKSGDEVAEAAEKAVRRLKREADIVVFGCNTASVTARPKGVFTLIPDLGHSLPSETLVLATPRTLAGLAAKEKGFMCASTAELAVLVEIQLSLRFKSRTRLDCSPLFGYLWERLAAFRGRAGKVLLGCSHYSPAFRKTSERARNLFSRVRTNARNISGSSQNFTRATSRIFSIQGFNRCVSAE